MKHFIKSSSCKENWLKTNNREVCFIGRSNVGKSSLINALFNNSKIARTSKKPGKTLLINFFNLNGNIIVDLPGYGYSKNSKKINEVVNKMVSEYFSKRKQLIKTFILIDSKVGMSKNDELLINYLLQKEISFFIILTKKDKANQSELYKTKKQIEKQTNNYLIVSTRLKHNIKKLLSIIKNTF